MDKQNATLAAKPRIVRPGPGRPHWVSPTPNPELIYLGWGRRDFSGSAITSHLNPGWTYVALVEGATRITSAGREFALEAPDCLIAGPDFRFGLRHEPGETCKLLVWIFKNAPEYEELAPSERLYKIVQTDPQMMKTIERLHAQSREEIARDCPLGSQSIKHLRALLDISLIRAGQPNTSHGEQDRLLGLAQQWMLNNLEIRDPVTSLCEYLETSPAILRQIFRAKLNTSPGTYHQNLRMQEAQRLISEEGWMVKQAAFRLGYCHPNDLSRALKRFKNA
ncbi:MAG: AraC family transcriptional regulator [Planctomycetota bacterium]